jgi:hypothetical protein
VLISILLIIGAVKVSDSLTVFSTLCPFPTKERKLG